jgi:predicted PurR-regulated permease PerM
LNQSLPELSPRQLVLGTLAVLAVGLLFWLLYRFHSVVILLFVAFVLATATRRLVRPLEARGLSRRRAAALVYGLLLALVVVFALLLLPMVLEQSLQLADRLPEAYEQLRQAMLGHPNDLIWRIGTELPEEPELTLGDGVDPAESTAGLMAGLGWLLDRLIAVTFTLVALFLLSFHWVVDGQRVKQALMLVLPLEKRAAVRAVVDEAEAKIGAFVTGQAVLSLAVGSMALVAYLILGLPYALALALIAALLEVVPLVGPPLATVPAFLVAISIDPAKAIWVVVAMVVIQQLENAVLVPRVMRRSVGIHPVVTLLSLISFSLLFGVAGALAAVPLAAVIQLFIDRHWLEGEVSDQAAPEGRDRTSRLQYQANELIADARRMTLAVGEGVPLASGRYLEEELEDIAGELARLLAEHDGAAANGGAL